MNRKEALKILGFSEDDNPSKWKVQIRYDELNKELELKFRTDENQDEEKTVNNEDQKRVRQMFAAYRYLTSLNPGMTSEEWDRRNYEIYMKKDLDEINTADDLQSSLSSAIRHKDVEYLKRLFSKFKSSKDGQFGDYINKPAEGLSLAIWSKDIEIIELFLKNGGDPNTIRVVQDNEIEKLLAEYGRVDKYSACQQLIYDLQIGLAALAVYITCNASPWCYVPIAVLALVAVFMVVGAIHDMFYTQTKWPSPDFDEASTEKVVNNVGLNAEDNSQKISNALA